jgi:hypothetical protein
MVASQPLRLSPMFAGVGTECRERNGVERLQSSESGANGASPVPRRWRQQLAGLGWWSQRPKNLCRLLRRAWLNALLKTGQPRALVWEAGGRLDAGIRGERVSASPAKPFRVAANLCADSAPQSVRLPRGLECNTDVRPSVSSSARAVAKGPASGAFPLPVSRPGARQRRVRGASA